VLFAAIAIGFAVYGWRVLSAPRVPPHAPQRRAPDPAERDPAQPIYIEPIPEKQSP
jgi:hypothetical protein